MIELCGKQVGPGQRLLLIAGPDTIESEDAVLRLADRLRRLSERFRVPLVFKCSFDKANRTSGGSFRGPGLERGLEGLARVKRQTGIALLTDVHETLQVKPAAEVADVLQIPAFLCRQTDLIAAAARTGKGLNIKKGQFVAPADMLHAARKAFEVGNPNVLVTERGTSFGYHNLVVDMRGLLLMREPGLAGGF